MTHDANDTNVIPNKIGVHDFVPTIPLSDYVRKQYLQLALADTGTTVLLETFKRLRETLFPLSRIYTRQICRPIFETLQANSSKKSPQCNDFPDFEKSVNCLKILDRCLLGLCLKF